MPPNFNHKYTIRTPKNAAPMNIKDRLNTSLDSAKPPPRATPLPTLANPLIPAKESSFHEKRRYQNNFRLDESINASNVMSPTGIPNVTIFQPIVQHMTIIANKVNTPVSSFVRSKYRVASYKIDMTKSMDADRSA